jgi:hypothetical protein
MPSRLPNATATGPKVVRRIPSWINATMPPVPWPWCAAADPSRRDILVAKSAAVLSKLEASNYFKDVVKLAYFFEYADFDGIREHPAFMRLVDTLPKPSTMPILSPHIQFIDTLPKLPLLPIRAPLAPG